MSAACNWPSGREIRRLSWSAALDTLARMGADVDPLELEGRRLSDLRDLVHDLKRMSHERGDCQCDSSEFIRNGGGTARPAPRPPAPPASDAALCPLDCYSGKPGCRCDALESEAGL